MNILVTGGAGFIGFHVAAALLKRGDHVVIVDNLVPYYDVNLKQARLNKLKNNPNLTIYSADIINFDELKEVFNKHTFDKICHLAAQAGVRYSIENPFTYDKTNNLGTLNIFELAQQHGVKDIVFASSSSVYGGNTKVPFSETDPVDKPISVYAATKRFDELLAHTYHYLYGTNMTALRFFTVYGPWGRPDMALYKFVKAILENKPINVYNSGNMRRDFTYITDIVAGVLAALDKAYPYEIFNLGNSHTEELNHFIACIEKELGKKAQKNLLPMQKGDVSETFADVSKAKRMLNFSPKIRIDEGIKACVQWYKQYHNLP